ncbi:probable ATP-dependent DNA helicase RecS [Ostrea edulis]|uniref:probable ATP-dependent DNA helicase RecS n=1 Tax=Ostrea edulis TaxID=37623 RepID=UPI0020942F89|nr:probable ATP-dependent DNA helicase RecS [Ostrea edulis]
MTRGRELFELYDNQSKTPFRTKFVVEVKMEDVDKIEAVEKEVCKLFNVEALKAEQKVILQCLLSKQDCMAVLPTGYGKSLPYQMYLPLIRQLTETNLCHGLPFQAKFDVNEKIIVCCPLVSLMADQVQRLTDIPNLKAAFKGNSQEGDDMIRKGEIDIIFASPETLVGDPFWRSQLQELSVGVIVIDEFHTITTWGGDDETEEQDAFRKWFRYVGELRAIFPHASVLALSATCTNKIKKQVSKILNLKQGLSKFISVSPNKTNIKLVVKKIDNAIETAMYWLIDSLENMKMNFPKTLIYANSIADVSKLYSYVVSELEECAKHVEMFHSETPEEKKKTIMTSLNQADSDIRVVFATSALGMGIDVSNCHSIILFGPPRSVLDLIQEIGRVGRDGERSVAILMHNSYHLRNVTSEMKKVFSDTNDCRRKSLLKHFLSDNEMQDLDMEVDKHTCCDKCTQNCSCGDCIKLEIENLVDTGVDCFSSSSSDSDTIDYEYEADDYQSFGNENLFDDDDDFTDLNLDSVHEIL